MAKYKVEYLSGPDTFINRAPEITFNVDSALNYSFYMADGTTIVPTTGTRWLDTTALGVSGTINGLAGQVVPITFSNANVGNYLYQHVVLANLGSQRRIFGYTNVPGDDLVVVDTIDRNLFWVPMYTVSSQKPSTGNIADTDDYRASGIPTQRQSWSLKAEFLTPSPTAGSFTSTITCFVKAQGANPETSTTLTTTVTYPVEALSATIFTNVDLHNAFDGFSVGTGRTGYYVVSVASTDLNAQSLFNRYYGGVSA
jgi:hypothetical protein